MISTLISGRVRMTNRYLSIIPITMILSALCISSTAYKFTNNQITSLQRQISLVGKYPSEVLKIQFTTHQASSSVFEYIMTSDMHEKVGRISFSKERGSTENQWYDYRIERVRTNEDTKENVVYIVDLKSPTLTGEQSIIYVRVQYLNRYKNLPEKISLSDDQKLQFEDYREFYSPYKVKQQTSSYKFSRLLSFQPDGQKTGIAGVTFRTRQPVQKFSTRTHVLHGVNNMPQMVYTEVEKIIQVSHWGNIAITQFYKLRNVGPELKGQFSRVQFNQEGNDAKNAFTGSETKLPYEIWGLYYRDEVGNISTSKAYRDNNNKEVKFGIVPRFFLLGGWKSNFQIGYNLDTSKGFLMSDGNKFEIRKIQAIYAFHDILAQKYSIKVILPEGSSNVKLRIGSQIISEADMKKQLSFSYLDFVGRPVFIVDNMSSLSVEKILEIQYEMRDSFGIFRKPMIMFAALFSMMLIGVIINRIRLQAFEINGEEDRPKKRQ